MQSSEMNIQKFEVVGTTGLTGVNRRSLGVVVGGSSTPPYPGEPPVEWPDWILNPGRHLRLLDQPFPTSF